jgi:predicted secreted protein
VTEHRIGPADAGRTVPVAAGDRLLVALPEIGGTGYTWQVDAVPAGGSVVEERYEHPPGGGIGGTSQHVFLVDPGDGGELRLRQLRPWEGDAGVIERFAVDVALSG